MIRYIKLAPLVLALGLITGSAHAALQGRDLNGSPNSFEAYYDTDLNLTWLADANYAKGSGYDINGDGRMNWVTANAWAANLSFTDGVNVYDNWRLPTVNPINGTSFNYSYAPNGSTDVGYNASASGTAYAGSTGSEMAHMYYTTLGNAGGVTLTGTYNYCTQIVVSCLDNAGPFSNLQGFIQHWSATEYAGYAQNAANAWYFSMAAGEQYTQWKGMNLYAWAVSPGDVAAVPEAQTYALMLAGLGLIGWRARRRG